MTPGTGRGAAPVLAPKSLVNCESLYRQSERLAVEVARNFCGPAVMVEAGVEVRVEVAVSSVFAVR